MDEYELKARTAPGLIVAIPVISTAVFAAPQVTAWQMFTATGVLGVALVYGLGRLAQGLGDSVEPALWRRWNGPPSTRFLRSTDSTFGSDLKASITAVIHQIFDVNIPAADEALDHSRADQIIFDVFRRVRHLLRVRDPKGLWHRHNAEYGFCRNLLGCRVLWAIVSALATTASLLLAAQRHTPFVNPGSVIGGLSLACAIYMGWCVLPAATKKTADNYAESAWMAFLHLGSQQSIAGQRFGENP